jgi:hypothetical protein
MKRRYNDGGEIKKKIADLQKLIKNPKTDAKFIPLYQKGIEKLQAKLQTIEPQEVEVEIETPKPRVEKTAPKVAKTTKPKAVEKVAKSVKKMDGEKVEIDGVIYDIDSKEFCDYLVEEFKERRANSISKKASKQSKPKTSNLIDNLKRGLVVRFETSDDNLLVSQDMFYDADISAIILYTSTETKRGKKSEKETVLSEQKAIAIYEMVKANSNYSVNEFYEN